MPADTCPACGSRLVEVDNPMRREVRHPRGVVCDGKPPTLPPHLLDAIIRREDAPDVEFRFNRIDPSPDDV